MHYLLHGLCDMCPKFFTTKFSYVLMKFCYEIQWWGWFCLLFYYHFTFVFLSFATLINFMVANIGFIHLFYFEVGLPFYFWKKKQFFHGL